MEKGPNPFAGHPYRDGVSEQEKIALQRRQYSDRFRDIVDTIKKPDGVNTLSNQDKELAGVVWEHLFVEQYLSDDYEMHDDVSFDSPGIARNLHLPLGVATFIEKVKESDLVDFKSRWRQAFNDTRSL